jgi:hypothetical protein
MNAYFGDLKKKYAKKTFNFMKKKIKIDSKNTFPLQKLKFKKIL